MNLTNLICETFETTKGTDTYNHVFVYSLSYLTGGYTAFELQALVKPFCVGTSAKEFRLKLLEHRPIYFGLKLFLLNLSVINRPDFTDFKAIVRKVGVDQVDARQAYRVWGDQSKFRARLKRVARKVSRFMPLTEGYATELFARVYPHVLSYVKSITYRKLRFIARSSNFCLADLHSELMLKVVQAFYKLVPADRTEAFVINYLRRVAHNHAMNLIQFSTTQKRGRLLKVGTDGDNNPIFSLTVMSENQLNVTSNPDKEIKYEDLGESDDQIEKFELTFSIVQLLDKYRARAKKFRFLLILMGQEDSDFTEWLQRRGLLGKAGSTNADLQMELSPDEYLHWVCKFMHVRQDSANVFLLKVRKELGFDYGTTLKAA